MLTSGVLAARGLDPGGTVRSGADLDPLGLALAGVVAAGIGMSRTLWIAAAVDLAAVAAILAAPSVRHLQRPGEPQLEHSAQQAIAD